jgi:flagellar biosynthetic protein FliR
VFALVPLPGAKAGPDAARILLAVCVTVALFPQWPVVDAAGATAGRVAMWILVEAALGIAIGLAVSFVVEAFQLGAQVVGIPAGYAYASTIDPTNQADSAVLLVFAQLSAGLLFFALGLDREVIRIFVRSLEVSPPGAVHISRAAGEQILGLGSEMFITGFKLALPAVGLLLLVDLALALLGRVNAQMQLLSLALPIKMLLALTVLGAVTMLYPTVERNLGESILGTTRRALGY